MVIKNIRVETTKEAYHKLLKGFNGRCYGNYKGLNLVLNMSITGRYYIELADYIDHIKR